MKFATKLNEIHPKWVDLNLCKIKRGVLASHGKITDGYSVNLKYIPRKYSKELLNTLPKELHPIVIGTAVTNIQHVLPHVHTNDKCVINFYKYTDNAPTIFFDGVVEKDASKEFGDGYFHCQEKYLTESERFYARSGEVWILNTTVPHSVLKTNGSGDRVAYQVYFSTPYETVLKILCKQEEIEHV